MRALKEGSKVAPQKLSLSDVDVSLPHQNPSEVDDVTMTSFESQLLVLV